MKHFDLQKIVLKDWIESKIKNRPIVWKKSEDDAIQGFTTISDNKAMYFIEKNMFLLDFPKMENRLISNNTVEKFVKSADYALPIVFDHQEIMEIDKGKITAAVFKHEDGRKVVVDMKYLKHLDNPNQLKAKQCKDNIMAPLIFFYEYDEEEKELLRLVVMPILE